MQVQGAPQAATVLLGQGDPARNRHPVCRPVENPLARQLPCLAYMDAGGAVDNYASSNAAGAGERFEARLGLEMGEAELDVCQPGVVVGFGALRAAVNDQEAAVDTADLLCVGEVWEQ